MTRIEFALRAERLWHGGWRFLHNLTTPSFWRNSHRCCYPRTYPKEKK